MAAKQIEQNDDRYQLLDRILFQTFDPFFARKLNWIFLISLFLLFLFGTLVFDVRVSEGGDDSSYLLEAMRFSQGKSFPSFHGTFYAVLIGWFISLFGFHLIFFKILSFVFLLVHQIFFFLTFRKRLSPFLLSMILLIISVNNGLLFYGSQTYTEAFYMMLQSILFYLLLNNLISKPNNFQHLVSSWKLYLGSGLVLFLLSITRNIGVVALLAVVLFFLFEKKYWSALYSFAGFALFVIPYNLYKRLVWDLHGSDLKGQFTIMLQKNPYNPTLGNETVWGMFERLFANTNLYLSRIFLQEAGLKSHSNDGTSIILTLLLVTVIVLGIILAYRSDRKFLRPVFLYVILILGATFVSLSQMWNQARMIIIVIPVLILYISWTLAETSKTEPLSFLRTGAIGFLVLIFFSTGIQTIRQVKTHRVVLKRNLAGDRFYGFTPDLKNYLSMSQWVSEHIPDDKLVAARLAPMSFVYGNGREFFPIYKVPFNRTDEILDSVSKLNKPVVFIDDLDLEGKPQSLLKSLKTHMSAIVAFDDAVFSLYVFETGNSADSLLQLLDVPVIHGTVQFRNAMKKELQESTTAYLPDKLLNELKVNNVHYIIDASLRGNPNEKSDKQVNTIKRYMIAISSKYPGIFTSVKQIGDNDKEPARLYKINYGKYNF